MKTDPFHEFKLVQKEAWSHFAPLEAITTPPAGLLVDFAKVLPSDRILDVGCGTGVVAVTAARLGAKVSALDLSPVLLERARTNAALASVSIEFQEGDAEALPYPDASFDKVLSQFGHMFAPRPEVVTQEMLRVLKPGGLIAFSTWPPELYTGKMFALVAKYNPPNQDAAPPPLWGDPTVVRERLGDRVKELRFDRAVMRSPSLSPQHSRTAFETSAGPAIKLVEKLSKTDPQKLALFRKEFEELVRSFSKNNVLHQHFLMTKAIKI